MQIEIVQSRARLTDHFEMDLRPCHQSTFLLNLALVGALVLLLVHLANVQRSIW